MNIGHTLIPETADVILQALVIGFYGDLYYYEVIVRV